MSPEATAKVDILDMPSSKLQLYGLSLIEVVIYIGLLGLILVFLSESLIQISAIYDRARGEREIISNARLITEAISTAVASAQAVYSPTSRFDVNLGQLSLVTTASSTPEHTGEFIDFWVDNGVLYERQEGMGTTQLSQATVRVNKFYLERIIQGLGREAVKITLEVDSAPGRFPTSITLNSTTALRGNY